MSQTFTLPQRGLRPHELAVFRSVDLDESPEAVKASAGHVFGLTISNVSAGTRYIHLYNVAAAGVTVGTTTPTMTFAVPTLQTITFELPLGVFFSTAIAAGAATTVGGNDAPGANDIIVNVFYS